MVRTFIFAVAVSAGGCGLSPDGYVSKYAEAECSYSLECFDAQVLEFNNWVAQTVDGEELTGADMCELDIVPRLLKQKQECTVYDKALAKACLDDWAVQGCPENGADPEVPEACAGVFSSCAGEQDSEEEQEE